MDLSNITPLIVTILLFACIIYSDRSRRKEMDNLTKQFKGLLSFVESLKFRVYDHERQLIGRDGIFVTEETGLFIFNILWNMIDEKRKQLIETEYKEVCPEEIPMWKYVLYSYKINSNFERKIELRNIDTVDDLLRGISKDTENLMDQVKSNMNKIQETKEKTDNLKSEMINSVKEITDSLVK